MHLFILFMFFSAWTSHLAMQISCRLINKGFSLNRYTSDRAAERRQPNKSWNQISASLICQGSAVMWTHTLLFFIIPVYATEERLFECHQQVLCHVTHSVQMWYLFRERRLPAFLPSSCFNGKTWVAWKKNSNKVQKYSYGARTSICCFEQLSWSH